MLQLEELDGTIARHMTVLFLEIFFLITASANASQQEKASCTKRTWLEEENQGG